MSKSGRGYWSAGRRSALEWFGPAFQRAFRCRARLVDVDAVGGHAHQHVRAGAGAQLAAPGPQPFDGLGREVLRQRRDDEPIVLLDGVRFPDDAPEPWLGHLMVGAVHQQQPAARNPGIAELTFVAVGAGDQLFGIVG